MLDSKLQRVTLTHISLTLVGLMWVFPFLHYYHKYPITTFYQEWWSALLGVLALAGLIARDYWREAAIPRIVQLPVALIVVVLLQMSLGMMPYAGQGLLYILYLLFAALLMMLGARLRDCFGLETLALTLAIFLLIGAESGALIGVLQHYRWHTWLDSVVVVKVSFDVYGNLAQRNHFADYTAIGLISLGLLFYQRKLPIAVVVLLALPLLFVMTLSGSRSSWLYLVMISLTAIWTGWRKPEFRSLWYYCLMVLAGFAAMNFLVRLPLFKAPGGAISSLQRFSVEYSGADATGGIRLYMWHEAWLMFAGAPWLGVGFGQFSWQHFQLGPLLQRTNLSGLYNNSHNLIFQLAAEAGIAGLMALFTSLGVWLYGLRRTTPSAAHWWGYAALGVLAIHSLLEYPLWYVYFLAIAAVLLGALDETRYRMVQGKGSHVGGRVGMGVILLFALLVLIQLRSAYQLLEGALTGRGVSGKAGTTSPLAQGQLADVQRMPLLSSYAELSQSALIEVNAQGLKDKLALNSRVLRFTPIVSVAYRQALLLAQSGQQQQAQLAWEQAIWSYPTGINERKQLEHLAEKDPAHFAALLEFALQKEQEYARAVHNQ